MASEQAPAVTASLHTNAVHKPCISDATSVINILQLGRSLLDLGLNSAVCCFAFPLGITEASSIQAVGQGFDQHILSFFADFPGNCCTLKDFLKIKG